MNDWVLLRGLTRESRHWGAFPDALRTALGGVRIHAPDLPGNGLLHAQESPHDIGAMVEACRRQVAAQGVAAPFGMLAMSLGAMVACEWASRHPQEVGALVLVNTSMRPFSPFHHRLRPRSYRPLLQALADWNDPLACESRILALTSRRHAADRALAATWAQWHRECPVSRANALRQLRAAAACRAPARPAAATLLLAAAGDDLVDPRCSAALAVAWEAPLRVHPEAGHDLPLDDAEWVARQVAEWWAGPRVSRACRP